MSVQEKIADLFREDIFNALLASESCDAEKAADLAEAVFKSLRKKWGGCKVYIPTTHYEDKAERNRRIVAEFNGRNHGEICQRYGINPSTLWRIVR